MRLDKSIVRNNGAGQVNGIELEAHPESRQFAFLLACVRHFFQPEVLLPHTAAMDWRKVVQLAERHRVLGLFCQAIRGRGDIPADVLGYLRFRTIDAARFDLTLNSELARLLELFARNNLATVTLKGPVLGICLYGNAALRSTNDLDLLIDVKDLHRAKQLLEEIGYQLKSTLSWPADSNYLQNRDGQVSFARQSDPQTDDGWVDLHWRLLPAYFPRSFDEREAWRSLRKVPMGGAFAWTLSPEHLLLFLCAHGTKHMWERLAWICDIARLLQVEPCLDWARVFTLARQTNTSRMVVLGLLLSSELLGVDPPPSAVEYISRNQTSRAMVMIKKRLQDEILTPASVMECVRFSRHAFERKSQGLRFLIGIFLEPTQAEYKVLKLPPRWHWFYYLVRPVRLSVKYARAWFRGSEGSE